METSRRLFILALGVLFIPAELKSITEWDGQSVGDKEYETVHGRILAVNLAHVRKRSVLENNTESENDNATEGTFQQIEKANKELLNRFFQGDINLEDDSELKEYIDSGGKSKNAVRGRKRLWTDRIIPYYIPYKMRHITSNVQAAVSDFHRKTCLRFVRYNRRYHKNYIEFDNHDGCSSKVGKRYASKGRQRISLAPGCNFVGTIIHELMHAIGFFHEQARSDRDRYVKIYWENILKGFKDQFDKYSWITIDDLGVSYDYQSIMHYDRLAFTKNGKPTIVAIGNENMKLSSPDFKLSTRDAVEINALYDCQTRSYGWTKWSGWTPCDKNCYRTRERYCYHSGNMQSCGGNVNVYGVEKQSAKCSPSICPAPIDGGWSQWSDWGHCSKTCNDGVRTRLRTCNKPAPRHGGKPCRGSAKEKAMCILKRCNLGGDDADFENFRLGMWTNSRSDDLNWQFKKGYTQTINTGPSADHTTGKGYYLYVESSYTRPGQRAWLVSPWQAAPADGKCLKFYYTMYGSTMGSLGILLELSDGRKWYIFYKKGNQGKNWKKAMGSIDPPQHLSYRLRIEAKIGQRGYSDIAIDDVFIDPGLCNCQDDFFTCHIWAAKGECTANSVWMKRNCKRSCKICRTVATAPPPITATRTCRDDAAFTIQCPLWGKSGECKKNPNWMLKHCKKSCNVCGENLTCKDKDNQCPIWATWGACHKNPAWMLPNCKLSCKQCK